MKRPYRVYVEGFRARTFRTFDAAKWFAMHTALTQQGIVASKSVRIVVGSGSDYRDLAVVRPDGHYEFLVYEAAGS